MRLSPTGRHRSVLRRALAATTAAVLVLGIAPVTGAAPASAAAAAPISVLVFHGAAAAQQDPVARAAQTIKDLGAADDVAVTTSTDPAVFSAAGLAPYRAVVFLSADGVVLNAQQESALQAFLKAGGGFLGIGD